MISIPRSAAQARKQRNKPLQSDIGERERRNEKQRQGIGTRRAGVDEVHADGCADVARRGERCAELREGRIGVEAGFGVSP